MGPQRKQHIETLRGLSIIAIVFFHSSQQYPLGVTADLSHFFCYSFGLPLFAAISGYIYAIRPVSAGGQRPFLWNKVQRILLPCISVSIAAYVLRVFMPGANNPAELKDIWRIIIFRSEQWWFLYALMLAFIVVVLLDTFNLINTLQRWALAFSGALLVYVFIPMNQWNISGLIFIMPYFLLGYGIKRFEISLNTPQLKRAMVATGGLSVIVRVLIWNDVILEAVNSGAIPLQLFTAIPLVLLLLYFHKDNRFLNTIGFYSYAIYLFHLLGGAFSNRAVRIFFEQPPQIINFLAHFSFGLILPIIAYEILSRIKPLSYLFLGIKPKPNATP